MPTSAKSKSAPKSTPKAKAEKPAAAPANPAARPLKKGDHLFLVDGSGYIFRAYHALPPLTRKSDGLQVNAVLGFCNMLWKLLADMPKDDKPTHLAVVFDKSEKTFRTEMYPAYKAHRPDLPEDLRPQFPLIRDAVRAFEIPCLEQAGFEADDLIATYARLAIEAKATTTIVSSDKDLMQLVGNGVTMYDTMKDKRIGAAEVMEKFGVGPDKVIEVQALIGDSSDNVPGVPGIGVKTAAQLIGEYGDLETLLKRAGEIKQDKRRQTLDRQCRDRAHLQAAGHARPERAARCRGRRTGRARAGLQEPDRVSEGDGIFHHHAPRRREERHRCDRRSSRTASRRRDRRPRPAPAGAGWGQRRPVRAPLRGPPARRECRQRARYFKSGHPCRRPRRASAHRQRSTARKYECVRTLPRLKEWIARAYDLGVVAVDTETTSLDPMTAHLCGFSLALAPNEACYVPIGHTEGGATGGGGDLFSPGAKLCADQIPEADALKALKKLLEDKSVLKIAQNMKYDWLIFAQRGIMIDGYDDTMLISYVLDAGKGGHGMDDLAKRWLSHDTIEFAARRRLRQIESHLRLRRHRQGDRIRRRRCRRDAAAVVGAEGAPCRRRRQHRL